MKKNAITLEEIIGWLVKFRDERDWKQFHNPKDLAIALNIEASELLEHFLWKNSDEVRSIKENAGCVREIQKEFADVMIFALLLAERLDIDPCIAILEKISENEKKYPIEKSKGSAKKYTEY